MECSSDDSDSDLGAVEDDTPAARQQEQVARLKEIMDLPTTVVSRLLKLHGEERLLDRFFADGATELLREAGLYGHVAAAAPPPPPALPPAEWKRREEADAAVATAAAAAPAVLEGSDILDAQALAGSGQFEVMLNQDALRGVIARIDQGDLIFTALASRTLRNAVFNDSRVRAREAATARPGRRRLLTPPVACLTSSARAMLGLSLGLPLSDLCIEAVDSGQLPLLKRAREIGAPWDIRVTNRAATGGHSAIMLWAVSQGCSWSPFTLQAAVHAGQLELLRLARERGCPWTYGDADALAEHGCADTLAWAKETGSPWQVNTYVSACRGGHLEIMDYLREHGCAWRHREDGPGPGPAHPCLVAAAEGGHVDVMARLRELECDWHDPSGERLPLLFAARRGHLTALQWLHVRWKPVQGEWRPACLNAAQEAGHQAVANWVEQLTG